MQVPDIKRIVERALGRIRFAFRAVITHTNNAPDVQLVQLQGMTAGDDLQDNELFQHFGFSSNPPAGTQGVVLPIGGKTAQGVIIATENGQYRFRPLEPGEAVVYNAFGDYIVMHANRMTEVVCDTLVVKAATKVRFETPRVEDSGDHHTEGEVTTDRSVTAAHDVADQGGEKTMAGMREVFNDHDHEEHDNGTTHKPNQQA